MRPSCSVAWVRVAGQALGLGDVVRIGELQHAADLFLGRAVEHRRRERHALGEVAGHLEDLVVRQVVELLGLAARLVVQLVEELAQLGDLGLLLQHVADALADALAGPAEVDLEHLADVHPRRHAERIEHDVARRAVGHVGHVLDRHDLRDDALVAVAAGHLVARLQAALDGQVDLDHLQHAGRQLVALRQLLALLLEREVEAVARLLERVLDRLELVGEVVVRRADVEPVVLLDAGEVGLVDRRALGDLLRAAVGGLADQQLLDPVERVGLDDAQLVVQVEAIALQLVVDDLLRALVALDAFAGEHLHVDDRAVGALVDAQRRVLHVGRLLAEDRAQQLFFRRQRGLALRRDLADQRVARVHFGTDVDDARLVEASRAAAPTGSGCRG